MLIRLESRKRKKQTNKKYTKVQTVYSCTGNDFKCKYLFHFFSGFFFGCFYVVFNRMRKKKLMKEYIGVCTLLYQLKSIRNKFFFLSLYIHSRETEETSRQQREKPGQKHKALKLKSNKETLTASHNSLFASFLCFVVVLGCRRPFAVFTTINYFSRIKRNSIHFRSFVCKQYETSKRNNNKKKHLFTHC